MAKGKNSDNVERKAIEYIVGRKIGDFHKEAKGYAYKFPKGKKWYTIKTSKVDDVIKHHEKALTMEDGGRIEKMVKSWKEEGRSFSKIDNDDSEFFKKIGVSSDEIAITSQTGSDILYYNDDIWDGGTKRKIGSTYAVGGEVRKMNLSDAVIYNDTTHYITEKNGLLGLTNLSQGAWGSNHPFIPIHSISLEDEVRDMYGNKVDIPIRVENFKDGSTYVGGGEIKVGDKVEFDSKKAKARVKGEVVSKSQKAIWVRSHKFDGSETIWLENIEDSNITVIKSKGGSTYQGGGTVIKKGNRVRIVNTQYDGKEGLVVSNDLHNGQYQVQVDGKVKGFPFENLMLLSRETYQGGGRLKRKGLEEKAFKYWSDAQPKDINGKLISFEDFKEDMKKSFPNEFYAKGGSTYAGGGETQGYADRQDESLGMRTGKEGFKQQSDKARREDSYGKWGKRDSEKRGTSMAKGGEIEMFSGWQTFGGWHTRKQDAIDVVNSKRKMDKHQDWKVIQYPNMPNKYWIVSKPKESMIANIVYAKGGGVGLATIKDTREHIAFEDEEWNGMSDEEKIKYRRMTYEHRMIGKAMAKEKATKSRGMSKARTSTWFTKESGLDFLNY